MTPAERARARETIADATPGPWFSEDQNGIMAVHSSTRPIGIDFEPVDSVFTALARTFLPAALDEIDALEAKIENLRSLIRDIALAKDGDFNGAVNRIVEKYPIDLTDWYARRGAFDGDPAFVKRTAEAVVSLLLETDCYNPEVGPLRDDEA